MLKNKKKKGFTIVELVIVIAVIGILAAILIPTFINLTARANRISNESFVRNINTQLAMDDAQNNKHETMEGALAAAKKIGFHVDDITPYEGNDIIWDETNDRFAIVKGDFAQYRDADHVVFADSTFNPATPLHKLWKFYEEGSVPATANQTYSIAPKGAWATKNIEVTGLKVGFDACGKSISLVEFVGNGDDTAKFTIRTNGGKLKIGAEGSPAAGTLTHYGTIDEAVVYTTGNSFHTHGAIGKMELKSGKAVAEKNGIVYLVEAADPALKLEEKDGGRFVIPAGVSTEDVIPANASKIGYTVAPAAKNYDEATIVGNKDYEIGSLSSLETFRDLVNGGFNFKGLTVKLTANITLNDGWTPIGEGSREVSLTNYQGSYLGTQDGTGTSFSGIFDGNNKTISNLNAKGYSPKFFSVDAENSNDKANTSYEVFTFGLFGIAYGATIKDLTLKDVNIDLMNHLSRPNSETALKYAAADSVGALVGWATGSLNVSGVEIFGTVKGGDAISGIVGRVTVGANQISISGCTNRANVTSDKVASGIVRLYKASAGNSVSLLNNKNYGDIVSNSPKNFAAGISVFCDGTQGSYSQETNDSIRIMNLTQSGNTNHDNPVSISYLQQAQDNLILN